MPIRARTKKPHNCDNIHLSISEYEVTHGFIFLHLNEAFLSFADYFITSIIQLHVCVSFPLFKETSAKIFKVAKILAC